MFLSQFRELLQRVTYLPNEVIEAGALVLLSTAISRKAYLSYSVRRYYPNLFMLFNAPSRSGKNVIIRNVIYRMARETFPETLLPRKWSSEKLYAILSSRRPSLGLMCNEEFGTFLMSAKKNYMVDAIAPFVELYDSLEHDSRELMSRRFELEHVYVVTALGTQPSTMENALKYAIFDTGFLPKFLMVSWERPKFRPVENMEDNLDVWNNIKKLLNALYIYNVQQAAPRSLKLTTRATEVYIEFTKYIDKFNSNYVGTLHEYALKIATLYAVDRDYATNVVTEDDIVAAINFIKRILPKTLQYYNLWLADKFNKQINRVLDITSNTWVPRSTLLRRVGLKAREFDEIINTLIERDELEYKTLATSGRPVTFYRRKTPSDALWLPQ